MEAGHWIAALIGASVSLIPVATKAVRELVRDRKSGDRQERKSTIDEWRELVERSNEATEKAQADSRLVREQLEIARKEIQEAQADRWECLRKYDRVVGRVRHLEDTLSKSNIPFSPWIDPDESGAVPHA